MRALGLISCCVQLASVLAACSDATTQSDAATNGGNAGEPNGGTGGMSDAASNGPSLAARVTGRYPAADGSDVCVDAQLRLTFDGPVTLGAAGKIQVFRTADPSTPVDSVDIALERTTRAIAGRGFQMVRPVFLDGSEAVVYLKAHALAAAESYFVTIDPGVFTDSAGTPLPGLVQSEWAFTTGSGVPQDAADIGVALDGSADFCSVQGAIDAVPAANATPILIRIKSGVYHEIVLISGKSNLTLRGEDRKQTVIAYPNNDVLQNGGGTKVRAMFSAESTNDLTLENLTLHNLTPQGGSQAEALRIDPGNQVIVRHADILSLQDTLLLSGKIYLNDCYVEGNVDFIWGKGTAYFDQCELKTVGRSGYNVQSRNLANYGYVFVDSKLTSDVGIVGNWLGRIEVDRFPQSNVAYINCQMGNHITPKGWLLTSGTDTSQLRFWEYGSTDLAGNVLDLSQRDPISRQLTDVEAAALRDKATVFSGWNPSP